MTTRRFPAAMGDAWRTFAAGPEAWQDGKSAPPALDAVVLLVQRVALLVAVTWPLVTLLAGGGPWDRRNVVLLVALAAAVGGLALVVPSVAVRRASRGRATLYLRLRLPLAAVVLVAWAGLSPDAALLGLWPLGVAAGGDVCRTAWVLGLDVRPRPWLARLARSPAHVGVVVTLVTFAVVQGPEAVDRLVWLYAALAAVVLTAVATAAVLGTQQVALERSWAAREQAVVVREHRARGHWLHDDVCSDLRLLRLRLEGRELAATDVLGELDDLDHRLRLRQLDEFIGSGTVRLAEVVQPFLRRAQQLRVDIVETPSIEDAGCIVDAAVARAIQRVVSVLVTNAVQAGSPTLALRLRVGDGRAVVEVEDEAGGFDLDLVPVGRGLDGLRHELGPAGLSCERTDGGSRVRAVVPLDGAPADPPAAGPSSAAAVERRARPGGGGGGGGDLIDDREEAC